MGEIAWHLLQPVDTGAQVQQGFATGMALVKQVQSRNALRSYLANPDDPNAYNALASFDPEAAASIQRQQMLRRKTAQDAADLQRQRTIGTQAAGGDYAGARTAALTSGDFDLAKHIEDLGEEGRKREHDRYQAAAPFAYDALKLPDIAARKAYLQSIKPQLTAAGWSADQIDGFEPTDAALGGIVRGAQTLSERMDQDKVTYRELQKGARFVPFDATGRPLATDTGQAAAPSAAMPAAAPSAAAGAVGAALSAGGLPAAVVAGFLGNFDVEGGYGGASGDGGTSHGIAQLHSPARIANFQRVIGKPVSEATPEEQAKFTLWELQNPHSAGISVDQRDAILAAKTPAEAAELIDRYYERSSGKDRYARIAAAERYGTPATPNADPATIKAQAQQAIAAGADPTTVKARAAAMGVQL